MVAESKHTYSLVLDKEILDESEQEYPRYRRQYSGLARILILASLVSNAFLAGYIAYTSWQPGSSSTFSILGDSPAYPVRYFQTSNYSTGGDEQEINMRWDDIIAQHGVVALDHTWAAGQGLSPALSLPSDDTKGVYLIDVYHSLHCLQEIRRSYHQLWDFYLHPSNKQDASFFPPGHYSHCFDYILRSMVCNPSDHLFGLLEIERVGDAQDRQCRDWRVLRDWASANSACDPNDTENLNPVHLDLPNLCHGKDDFIPHGINTEDL